MLREQYDVFVVIARATKINPYHVYNAFSPEDDSLDSSTINAVNDVAVNRLATTEGFVKHKLRSVDYVLTETSRVIEFGVNYHVDVVVINSPRPACIL